MPVEYWCYFDGLNVNIESTVSESLPVQVRLTLWFDNLTNTSVRADTVRSLPPTVQTV